MDRGPVPALRQLDRTQHIGRNLSSIATRVVMAQSMLNLCQGKHHFFKPAVQFTTTVVGVVSLSSGTEAMRKRWPSAVAT
jgi:hypothetical protein